MKDTFAMHLAAQDWRPTSRMYGLSAPLATVAFAGIFNTGKSSLINRIIGHDKLPTGPLPETGCPVRLVHRVGAPVELRFQGIEDRVLRDLTSLHDADGERRVPGANSRGLTLALDRPGFPKQTALIDLPGINDEGPVSTRSFRAAVAADAVLLVLNSRQFLSLVEQDFLARLIDARGSAGLALAVNLIVPAGIPFARWADRALPTFEERRNAALRDVGLDPIAVPVFEVNAHPEGGDPMSGLSRLNSWIRQFDGPDAPETRSSREQRAANWRKRIVERMSPRLEKAKEDLTRVKAQEQRHQRDNRESVAFFSKDLPEIWLKAQNRLLAAVEAEAKRFGQSISADGLVRDDRYEKRLFLAVSNTMIGTYLDGEIRLALAARDLPPPDSALLSALRRAVSFRLEPVTVADTPLAIGRIAAITVLGTILTLGVGAIAGTAATAHALAEKNRTDIEKTGQSLDAAAQGYLDQFYALRLSIADVIAPNLYVTEAPSDLAERMARLDSLNRRASCI